MPSASHLLMMSDGNYFEGRAPKPTADVLFVESKLLVPIREAIVIRPIESSASVSNLWNVAEGKVVWHCPSADLFKGRKGFGVRLRGCWKEGQEAAFEADSREGRG